MNLVDEKQKPGYAPWGTRKRMRGLALGGLLCVAITFVIGTGFLVTGNHRGWVLIAVGALLTIYWAILLHAARRRGKI